MIEQQLVDMPRYSVHKERESTHGKKPEFRWTDSDQLQMLTDLTGRTNGRLHVHITISQGFGIAFPNFFNKTGPDRPHPSH